MKLRMWAALGAAAVLVAGAGTDVAQAVWRNFSDEATGVSLDLPGEPKVERAAHATPQGNAPSMTVVVDLPPGDHGVLVLVADQRSLPGAADPEAMIDESVANVVGSVHAVVDATQPVAVAGGAGRIVNFHTDKFIGRMRWTALNRRVVGVIGLGVKPSAPPVEIDRMVASLKISS
jgi:hypothetical protein